MARTGPCGGKKKKKQTEFKAVFCSQSYSKTDHKFKF